MPDRLRLRACDSNSSSTSPSKTVLRFRFSAPGHIATANVTRHLAAKQSHVLQELDAKIRVAEEKRAKIACLPHRHLQARHARKMFWAHMAF